MTAAGPPRRPLTWHVLWFVSGLAIFAAIGVLGYFALAAARGQGQLVGAVLMLALTAGLAIFAMRRGNVVLGSGLLAGYALATVFSAGQCTLWRASGPDYGFLAGFIYYGFALGAGLVLLLAVLVGETVYNARRKG